ncbi:unnamed protein product [Clonostachys solani]|uniref:Uncharacterized protein n=1 Tax=Clonostachys solani TaxID=160281 RepID=A0A9P0EIC7_9HYPO|nr:unnamed protein product [Clonostachys solani]
MGLFINQGLIYYQQQNIGGIGAEHHMHEIMGSHKNSENATLLAHALNPAPPPPSSTALFFSVLCVIPPSNCASEASVKLRNSPWRPTSFPDGGFVDGGIGSVHNISRLQTLSMRLP